MRFIQFLLEQDDWDNEPVAGPHDDRISQRLNALHHEEDQLYKQALKLTDPYACARLRPMDSHEGNEPLKKGYLSIPMCYEGDPMSPQFLVVNTNIMEPSERKQIERLFHKMYQVYQEQQRLGNILLQDYPGEPDYK